MNVRERLEQARTALTQCQAELENVNALCGGSISPADELLDQRVRLVRRVRDLTALIPQLELSVDATEAGERYAARLRQIHGATAAVSSLIERIKAEAVATCETIAADIANYTSEIETLNMRQIMLGVHEAIGVELGCGGSSFDALVMTVFDHEQRQLEQMTQSGDRRLISVIDKRKGNRVMVEIGQFDIERYQLTDA